MLQSCCCLACLLSTKFALFETNVGDQMSNRAHVFATGTLHRLYQYKPISIESFCSIGLKRGYTQRFNKSR